MLRCVDNLKTLLEVRYDRGSVTGLDPFFVSKHNPARQDQTLALIQMMYTF